MKHYFVDWTIELEADSPEHAARQALQIQRDPASIATVFYIFDEFGVQTTVDLEEENESRA